MLNRSTSLAMSTCVLKALPGKLDIKRHSPSILYLDSIHADCQRDFRSQGFCETKLVQFVHDIIGKLDGAVNRGHEQTDLIIVDFASDLYYIGH